MGLYGDLGREQDRRFAKAERPEGTQGMSKSEGLAKGERHGVTQAMSEPKVCERREARQ